MFFVWNLVLVQSLLGVVVVVSGAYNYNTFTGYGIKDII